MKRYFLMLSAAMLSAAVVFSCKKVNPENGGGEIINGPGQGNENLHESLKGSSYFPIILDGTTFESIKSKVAADLRPDDVNKFFYIWDGTYTAGTASGLNFYGLTDGFTCLVVGSAGWSGGGFFVNDKVDGFSKIAGIQANINDYYLHVAYKGAAGVPHLITLVWGEKTYPFAIGDGQFEDNGKSFTAIAPKSGKFAANAWNEYEIALKDTGIDFTGALSANADGVAGSNIVTVLSGGTTGREVNLDALFIYKK